MTDTLPTGSFLNEYPIGYNSFDYYLAQALCIALQGKTVGDFGCGDGFYVRTLIESGIPCMGYDGNPNTRKFCQDYCQVLDLAVPMPPTVPLFDWIISLEVGEHIPQQYEEVFLKNTHEHCREGVILSWAVPGQPGVNHVNCMENSEVIEHMKRIGFSYSQEYTDELRKKASFEYFRNTLMVFTK